MLAASGFASQVAVGAAGAAGAAGLAPVLGGLGLVGAAGAAGMGVMAMQQCGGPLVCVSPSGRCCMLRIIRGRFRCPRTC